MKHALVSFLIFLLTYLLFGCADRRYLPPTPSQGTPSSSPSERGESSPQRNACPYFFSKKNLCASISWPRIPIAYQYERFHLHLSSSSMSSESMSSEAVNKDVQLHIFLWMPSMGHGSSPVNIVSEHDGSYWIEEIFFNMPGAWDIHIQLKNQHDVIDEIILPLQIE
jgi:hypothetical protein